MIECCKESTVDDVICIVEDDMISEGDTACTSLFVEGDKIGERMAGEVESGGLDECTLAVPVVKGDAFEGDGSVSFGGAKGVLSGGDGCAWGGKCNESADEGDCG